MVDKDEPTPDTKKQEPRVLWDPVNGVAGREAPLEEVVVMVSSGSETACPKTQKQDDQLGRRSHLDCVRLEKPLDTTQQGGASSGEQHRRGWGTLIWGHA